MMFVEPINERTSGRYLATLVDETGALVPGSALQSATLSLFATLTGAIVNGWTAKNILNANGWTFYESLQTTIVDGQTFTYNVAWVITPADGQVIDPALATEGHTAEVQVMWSAGAKGATHRFKLNVANLRTIT